MADPIRRDARPRRATTQSRDPRALVSWAVIEIVVAVLAIPTAAIAQVVFDELVPADAREGNVQAGVFTASPDARPVAYPDTR